MIDFGGYGSLRSQGRRRCMLFYLILRASLVRGKRAVRRAVIDPPLTRASRPQPRPFSGVLKPCLFSISICSTIATSSSTPAECRSSTPPARARPPTNWHAIYWSRAPSSAGAGAGYASGTSAEPNSTAHRSIRRRRRQLRRLDRLAVMAGRGEQALLRADVPGYPLSVMAGDKREASLRAR